MRQKSYMCTDLNLLCLHTNYGYFNVFQQVFLRYCIADDFVYVVMKRGCLHLARQIWHPLDWLIDSVHGFPAVMIGTCSDHLNRYSRCLQHVDVLFLIVLCLLGVFFPIHFCLCWCEFSIATNKIFFKRFSSYVHSSSYYSLLHFFLATCLRTFPSLGVGIETREFSALFFDLHILCNMSLPLTFICVFNWSIYMPLSLAKCISTCPPFPGASLDFNDLRWYLVANFVQFITAFFSHFFQKGIFVKTVIGVFTMVFLWFDFTF